jgi:hypothetical protein
LIFGDEPKPNTTEFMANPPKHHTRVLIFAEAHLVFNVWECDWQAGGWVCVAKQDVHQRIAVLLSRHKGLTIAVVR